jgi:hypothetical protein
VSSRTTVRASNYDAGSPETRSLSHVAFAAGELRLYRQDLSRLEAEIVQVEADIRRYLQDSNSPEGTNEVGFALLQGRRLWLQQWRDSRAADVRRYESRFRSAGRRAPGEGNGTSGDGSGCGGPSAPEGGSVVRRIP